MENVTALNSRIFSLAQSIEDINGQIIRLRMRKEDLLEKLAETRRVLSVAESHQSIRDWNTGQRMTLDLLREEVGSDVFDV